MDMLSGIQEVMWSKLSQERCVAKASVGQKDQLFGLQTQ